LGNSSSDFASAASFATGGAAIVAKIVNFVFMSLNPFSALYLIQ